jgi:hypothetical protein
MPVIYKESPVFEADNALLEITRSEGVRGQFGPQVEMDFVVRNDGEDGSWNGYKFRDWAPLKEVEVDGKTVYGATPNSKIGAILVAALGEEGIKNLDANADWDVLEGKLIRSRVFRPFNEKTRTLGKYSKLDWETIGPARSNRRSPIQEAQQAVQEAEEEVEVDLTEAEEQAMRVALGD